MPKQCKCLATMPYLLRQNTIRTIAIADISRIKKMFPALTLEKATEMFYDEYKLTDSDISYESIKMLYYQSTKNEKTDLNICKNCTLNCNSRKK